MLEINTWNDYWLNNEIKRQKIAKDAKNYRSILLCNLKILAIINKTLNKINTG